MRHRLRRYRAPYRPTTSPDWAGCSKSGAWIVGVFAGTFMFGHLVVQPLFSETAVHDPKYRPIPFSPLGDPSNSLIHTPRAPKLIQVADTQYLGDRGPWSAQFHLHPDAHRFELPHTSHYQGRHRAEHHGSYGRHHVEHHSGHDGGHHDSYGRHHAHEAHHAHPAGHHGGGGRHRAHGGHGAHGHGGHGHSGGHGQHGHGGHSGGHGHGGHGHGGGHGGHR